MLFSLTVVEFFQGNYKTVVNSAVYVGTFRKVMESKYGVSGIHLAR